MYISVMLLINLMICSCSLVADVVGNYDDDDDVVVLFGFRYNPILCNDRLKIEANA